MAEIKWIKLSTDLFNNRKIKQIESMPEGDTLVVIWLKLLILAGDTNDGGLVYFTKDIPFTDQLLAHEFNRPLATIQLALTTFQRFGMIEIVDDMMMISNWEKYQSVDRLSEIREYNRLAKQRQREKQKALSMTSQGQVNTDIDKEEEVEEEVDKEIKEREEDKRNKVRIIHFTPPTLQEVRSYCAERKNMVDPEHFLDYYEARGWILSNGKKCRDWKACVRTWEKKEWRSAPVLPHKSINQQNAEAWAQYLGKENTNDKRADEKLLSMEESDFYIH